MKLNELREPVRRNLVSSDIEILDILATGHNLIKCIENNHWERLHKKLNSFIGSYNYLITNLNKKETPIEDEIIQLEERIKKLKEKK